MDVNQLNVANSKSIIEILTAILRKFSKEQLKPEILKQLIIPYFVNFYTLGGRQILDEKLNHIIDQFDARLKKNTSQSIGVQYTDEDDDDMFNSKKFPTVNEIKGLISLVNIVKENYKFIHPFD